MEGMALVAWILVGSALDGTAWPVLVVITAAAIALTAAAWKGGTNERSRHLHHPGTAQGDPAGREVAVIEVAVGFFHRDHACRVFVYDIGALLI